MLKYVEPVWTNEILYKFLVTSELLPERWEKTWGPVMMSPGS